MELVIVTILLGVLAAIGIPSYQRTIESNYYRQAQDLLLAIYHGERAYELVNGAYIDGLGQASAMDDWRQIHMDNPNLGSDPRVIYSVSTTGCAGTPCFTATATRNGGGCNGRTQTIDQTRTQGGDWPSNGAC